MIVCLTEATKMRMSINTPEDITVNEQFVQLVRKTPILWNLHLPYYRNKRLKEQKWVEVGAHFNLTGAEAYRKFVGLREKYKREQKLAESRKLAPVDCWCLYEKLRFLDSVSISRERRCGTPKTNTKGQRVSSIMSNTQDFNGLVKTEFPNGGSSSESHSGASQIPGEPFDDSCETFQDSCNEVAMHGIDSDSAIGTDFRTEEHIESTPDTYPHEMETHSSCSRTEQFLTRLETKTNAILSDCTRRSGSWARCETLGNRVAQTMFALEENDPDLALKFDIMLSEAITSIKKSQLERLTSGQTQ
ncbi:uncharacterized protein LOC128743702 [Sabethes cyaneus]|uniref:uncharacterized protein LOC128743702 n=1 Tax=Sabethes cyaneus TaxID=53552 RepID=UPI00237D41E0|nr:uncharacterized protein LOC128743702 [Sabethes cyaneus]